MAVSKTYVIILCLALAASIVALLAFGPFSSSPQEQRNVTQAGRNQTVTTTITRIVGNTITTVTGVSVTEQKQSSQQPQTTQTVIQQQTTTQISTIHGTTKISDAKVRISKIQKYMIGQYSQPEFKELWIITLKFIRPAPIPDLNEKEFTINTGPGRWRTGDILVVSGEYTQSSSSFVPSELKYLISEET